MYLVLQGGGVHGVTVDGWLVGVADWFQGASLAAAMLAMLAML